MVNKWFYARLIMGGISILAFTGCDLVTKAFAKSTLQGSAPWTVIPGFWDFQYAENRDIGFSLLRFLPYDMRQAIIYILVLIGFVFVSLYGFRRMSYPLAFNGSILVASGALGNFIDRAMNGYVTDFVHWFFRNHHWPVFNVADICIVLGVLMMMIHEWFFIEKDPTEQKQNILATSYNSSFMTKVFGESAPTKAPTSHTTNNSKNSNTKNHLGR